MLLRYCDAQGARPAPPPTRTARSRNIAGVCNARGNVFGLMPHPEHAVEAALGGEDGRAILGSLVDVARGGAR